MKKLLALTLALILCLTLFAGCESGGGEGGEGEGTGQVYFLNFKPEVEAEYNAIAAAYTEETGVPVKVVTAASGTYEDTLKSEIAKSDAPTIFQINGPVGYQNWKDYCAELTDTDFYSWLSDKSLAVEEDGKIYAVPYAVEGYGIIYNDAILKQYFAMEDKAVDISSAEEITSFDLLKAVVEDMQAKKDALGIQGVFGSTSMMEGNQWRWTTHLLNMPFYYEFLPKMESGDYATTILAGMDAAEVEFKYNENFKNLFDLYLNNSITAPKLTPSKTVDESMVEFALGQVAMIQNGDWGWNTVAEEANSVVKAEDVKFLPLYMGIDDATQGVCVGTENYLCINKNASEADQAASIAFLEWLFGSDAGKEYVLNDLGFTAPFTTFGEGEEPANPLAASQLEWMNKEGITNVQWTFNSFPSEAFKDDVGNALLMYIQGTEDWDGVVETTISSWKTERGL